MVHGGGDVVHLADDRPGGLWPLSTAERARCAGGVLTCWAFFRNMADAGGGLFDRGGNRAVDSLCALVLAALVPAVAAGLAAALAKCSAPDWIWRSRCCRLVCIFCMACITRCQVD